MNKWIKLLIEYVILSIICLICMLIPYYNIIYFGGLTKTTYLLTFFSGAIYGIYLNYNKHRRFKKEAQEGFEKALIEQQEHYSKTLIGLNDQVISRLKENDNENNKRPL